MARLPFEKAPDSQIGSWREGQLEDIVGLVDALAAKLGVDLLAPNSPYYDNAGTVEEWDWDAGTGILPDNTIITKFVLEKLRVLLFTELEALRNGKADAGHTHTTAQITELTNLYFTQARVRSTPLTGLSASASRILPTASDDVLTFAGKVLKYFTDFGGAAYLNVGTSTGTVADGGTVGNTASLNTTTKTSVVAAVNEVNSKFWTPARLSTTTLWIEPAITSTLTQSGGVVSAVQDLSSLGISYSQGTSVNRPTYNATGFNGRPGLVFNGSQVLSAAGAATNVLGDASQILVVLAVISNPAAANTPFGAEVNSNNRLSAHLPYSDGIIYWDAGNTSTARQYTSGNFNSEGLASLYRNGTYGSIRKNGADLITSNAFSGTASLGTGAMGFGNSGTFATNGLQGTIGLMVIVKGSISNDDLLRVEGYVAHRTGLQANLPSAHPFRYNPPLYFS